MGKRSIVLLSLVFPWFVSAGTAGAQRVITTPAGMTSGPMLTCEFAGLRNGAAFSFAVEGANRAISAEGDDWFQPDVDNSASFLRNSGVRMYPRDPEAGAGSPTRVIRIDLGNPVTADARDFGPQIVDRIVVHWKQDDEARLLFGPLDLPVGGSVSSQRTEVFTTIDDKKYLLRFGNMDVSVCWPGDAPVSGEGTTEPVLIRTSEKEWILDIPRGGRGRLSEMFGTPVNFQGGGFIDRGLYEVSARIRFRLERIEEQ